MDESVGRVTAWLQERGLLESTLVIYMGDNGFAFGEHGLIDKRTAYEESMRVPMLIQCPELVRGGTVVDQVVANIDVAPTILEAAGLRAPGHMAGRSMMPLLQGQATAWRDTLLYVYYWERNFPQTPTLHALRGSRYKYIRYQGIWDIDELYDLQTDPLETTNLIFSEAHQATVAEMNQQLFDLLGSTAGMSIPIYRDSWDTEPAASAGRIATRGISAPAHPRACAREATTTMTHIIHRHLHVTPPVAVSGAGVFITDASGKQYIDARGEQRGSGGRADPDAGTGAAGAGRLEAVAPHGPARWVAAGAILMEVLQHPVRHASRP